MATDNRQPNGPQPAEDVRAWAHRLLDELFAEVAREDFFGAVGLELSIHRGAVTSVMRRLEWRIKPPRQ